MYSVLKGLCLPAKPSDKKYVQLAELLSKYYKPELSSVAVTYLNSSVFNLAQNRSETMSTDLNDKLLRAS